MVNDCSCAAGTEDNGWQETTCTACIRAEIKTLGHVRAWHRHGDIVKRIQAEL